MSIEAGKWRESCRRTARVRRAAKARRLNKKLHKFFSGRSMQTG